MNEPRFEVFPESRDPEKPVSRDTVEFAWRLRAADAEIDAIGGEGFTRREDAHRAIRSVALTLHHMMHPGVGVIFAGESGASDPPNAAVIYAGIPLRIVDLDEDGRRGKRHRGRSAMSAAVKYLTKKVAKANAEYEMAREEHRKAAKRAEECSERAWDVRRELDEAVNADIEKAKENL